MATLASATCPGCGRLFFKAEPRSDDRLFESYCRSAQCKRYYQFRLHPSGVGPVTVVASWGRITSKSA